MRIRPSPVRTRIVFDLTKQVDYKLFTLKKPHRLVVDMKQTRFKAPPATTGVADTPIASIRSARQPNGDLRVVFDLADEPRLNSFSLKPIPPYGNRLVIDILKDSIQTRPALRRADLINQQKRDLVIAIDAGHGGDDPGALGPNRLPEKTIVLNIAKKLHRLFEDEPGFSAEMIRQGDYYIGLRNRTKIARKNQADVFLSIHADAAASPSANGASVYVLSEKGASSEAARWLAEKENRADLIGGVGEYVPLNGMEDQLAGVILDISMTQRISESLGIGKSVLAALGKVKKLHKQQVEQAGFAVLKSPDMPSLLIETGYISNPREARRLASETHQRKVAQAIFTGVKDYFMQLPPDGTYLAWIKQGNGVITHTIKSGDTLSEIAARYRVSSRQIKQLNGLRSDKIIIGQQLKIPGS